MKRSTDDPMEVRDIRENSTGVYYTLNARTTGTGEVPVTVKHSTRYDTMVCLTCNTHDACIHARFVRRIVEATDQTHTNRQERQSA